MNILIDCGAFTGDSLPTLIKGYGPFDRIVCFEANTNLEVQAPDNWPGIVEVINAAVWKEDGEMRFFMGDQDISSSVMENKVTGNLSHENSNIVPCINLARWLEENTRAEDNVTLKIDIEGAEYDVLDKLSSNPVLKRLDNILVEWHENRLTPRWRYRLRRRLLELSYFFQRRPLTRWSKKAILAIEESST